MARRSKLGSMRAVSALLVFAVAGLAAVGVVKIRDGYDLTGAGLIGWAFVPLAVLLGFTLPVRCRVKRTSRKACGNWAYGLLFGCTKVATHWSGKFLVRLGLKSDEAKPVTRRQPSGSTVYFNQPGSGLNPVKVTVEESVLAKCGFWIGLTSGIIGIVEAVISVTH